MELVGDDALPRLVDLLLVIRRAQMHSGHSGPLHAVSQIFILTVPAFAHGTGGVSTYAVIGGDELVVPHGEALLLLVGEHGVHIAENLICGG